MTLSTGQILRERYRIARLLGQGGFGAVYRAWDMNLDKLCALKENLDTSENAQRQFKREARMLSDLSHPNLPRVIDHFIVPGQGQYLVMDFIEGQDLQEKLAQSGGQLAAAQALDWIIQVCTALEYLHSQNPPVIHRDIKPANIKITPAGKAVLVDFGIAKAYDPAARTTVGARAVTPGFSPLEQYSGSGLTDARTDVYALGATLYMLLTGQTPPEAPDRNLGTALAAPRQLNPAVPPALEQVTLAAMALLPEGRYQSAQALRQALEAARQGASDPGRTDPVLPTARAAPPPSFTTPPQSLPQGPASARLSPTSLPWGWIAAGALAVVVILWSLLGGGSGESEREATLTPTLSLKGEEEVTETAVALKTTAAMPTTQVPATTAAPPTTQAPPTATFTPTGLPLTYTDEKGVPMALVPAGDFWMGSDLAVDSNAQDDEQPQHQVSLDDFYLDVYEVTNRLFAEFLNAQGNQSEGGVSWLDASDTDVRIHQVGGEWQADAGYAEHPVVEVSWYGAQAFCGWRGARLPSEAEWEKAARGTDGRIYPWGDTFDCHLGNFDDETKEDSYVVPGGAGCDGFDRTAPVGSFPEGASPYGLLDMAGNVWEWVQDWYQSDYYETLSTWLNPFGPASGEYRGLRGGSWDAYGSGVRSAYRGLHTPDNTLDLDGFRCLRSR